MKDDPATAHRLLREAGPFVLLDDQYVVATRQSVEYALRHPEVFHRRIPEHELAPGGNPTIDWPSGTLEIGHLPIVFPIRSGW